MSDKIQCDRCGQMLEMSKHPSYTEGYYDVSNGYWSKFARWEEKIVCDHCMHSDPKYQATYDPNNLT